jgi:thymidylate kinase
MPPPILVTVSGMVGSGKSTGEHRIHRLLQREGVKVQSWHFRTLPCFSFPFGPSRRPDPSSQRRPGVVRGRGYTRRTLTFNAAAGYLARMVAFRVYRRWRQPAGWTVCNRYFYDSLAHYELDDPAAQKYLAALRWFMPRAELAIVFVASPGVVAERRPIYAGEYLEQVGQAYSRLTAIFPNLVVVNSDPSGDGGADVERLVEDVLRRTR